MFKCAKAHNNVYPVTKEGNVYCRITLWREKTIYKDVLMSE